MSPLESLVQRYLDGFNETDPARRSAIVREVFAEDARYTDPAADVAGHAGIDALLAGVQRQFPGLVFTRAGAVDAHHDQARFTWHAAPAGAAESAAVGFDVIVLEAGRIRRVYGFLDRFPG